MEFEEKKQRAMALLIQKKMWASNAAPPLIRLLWRVGVKIPPLPFCSFWHITLILGSYFCISWGAVMWLLVWRTKPVSLLAAVSGSLIAGAAFGAAMALLMLIKRKRLKLPRWEEI